MLRVEIADSPHKQAQGLMFRKSLPEDDGMIFIFRKAEKLRFWGVNTYIPLDIAFVDQHHRITKISHIKPLSDKSVQSDTDCHIAIEANLGFFEDRGIKVGDTINFDKRSDRIGIVDFVRSNRKTAQLNPQPQPEVPVKLSPDELDPAKVLDKLEKKKKPQQEISSDQTQMQNGLPVVNVQDLGGILEDSFDDKEGVENNALDTETPDENENIDPEMQQPEVSPTNHEEELYDQPEDFEIPEKEYPDFGSPQDALKWAEQNHEVVRIWYTTKGGRDIERKVEPHGQFVAESTGNPIVVTFDETIGDIRAFILSNVLYQSFLGKKFNPKFVFQA